MASTKLTSVAAVYSVFCTLIQHEFLEKILKFFSQLNRKKTGRHLHVGSNLSCTN